MPECLSSRPTACLALRAIRLRQWWVCCSTDSLPRCLPAISPCMWLPAGLPDGETLPPYFCLKEKMCGPFVHSQKDRCTSHSTGCVQVGVTQRRSLIHYMGATLLWALGSLRSTLQGFNQIFFLICHNQAMLGGGEWDRQLESSSGSQEPWNPNSVFMVSFPSIFLGLCY